MMKTGLFKRSSIVFLVLMRLWGQIFLNEFFWVACGHEHSNDENCQSESEGGLSLIGNC
jgi:hypothetical protein